MDLPEYTRRKLATDQRTALTPQQYNETVAVARQLPLLRVERAFFKCRGEKYIVTGSLVQFVVKARIIPPGTADVPPVAPAELEDPDPEEGGEAAAPRKAAAAPSKRAGVRKVVDDEAERDVVPPLAHAPFFARDHSPRWHLLLAETKQHRVAVPPSSFAKLDAEAFGADGRPTFNVQTLKLTFQAPPVPGTYTFVAWLVCDSYVGFDERREVKLVVEDAEKAVDIESEEEISEPDEGEFPFLAIFYSLAPYFAHFLLAWRRTRSLLLWK